MYTGNNMSVIGILVIGLTAMCGHAMAQSSSDVEGAKAASKAFYSALSVIDNGAALDKVVAHTSYVTLVGPRDKAVRVGYALGEPTGRKPTSCTWREDFIVGPAYLRQRQSRL